MSQENRGFQVLNLDDAFSGDEIEKNILKILEHLSRIFHDKPCFQNHGNGFMHTLNDMGTRELSCLHIFYKDPKEMGCPITLHLTFTPCWLIDTLITIKNEESGRLLKITFLDRESFEFDHHSWQLKKNTLQMIWSWESDEIFDEIQRLATKLIEITVGPVSL